MNQQLRAQRLNDGSTIPFMTSATGGLGQD